MAKVEMRTKRAHRRERVKDFYLMTPIKRYKYFRMKLELFPQDIIKEYSLTSKVNHNGNVHCEVQRGMYGLP
jgi:hypothetical protein